MVPSTVFDACGIEHGKGMMRQSRDRRHGNGDSATPSDIEFHRVSPACQAFTPVNRTTIEPPTTDNFNGRLTARATPVRKQTEPRTHSDTLRDLAFYSMRSMRRASSDMPSGRRARRAHLAQYRKRAAARCRGFLSAGARPRRRIGRGAARRRHSLRATRRCAACRRSAPANPACSTSDRGW